MTRDPQIAGPMAGVNAISAPLRDLFRPVETDFLYVGDRLGAAVIAFGDLTRIFETLPLALESEEMGGATACLRELAADVAAMGSALPEEEAELKRLITLNQTAGRYIEQLHRSVTAISILTINAQIAAASLDRHGSEFTSFTREMVGLCRSAEATIKAYAGDHETLSGLLKSAGTAHAEFRKSQSETLRSVSAQLAESLGTVDAHRREAAMASTRIGTHSKQIANQIGVLVMALQIGDITRQRAEHVVHALDVLAADPEADAEGDGWRFALSEDQVRAVSGAVCRLQSAQLAEAWIEFDRETGRIASSLDMLAGDATRIGQLRNEIQGSGSGADDGSFLEDLEIKMDQARRLIRQCHKARSEIDRLVGTASQALGLLIGRVDSLRSIEADMRLLGLNTTLKCGQLGNEGRTLSVIAQALRGYAQQIAEDGGGLRAALQETAAAAGLGSAERLRGESRLAVLEERMDGALAVFKENGVRLGKALSALARDSEKVGADLSQAATRLALREKVGAVFSAARQALDDKSRVLPEGGNAAIIWERLKFFASDRYSMASERDIHRRIVSFGKGGPSSPAKPEPVGFLEDILF